MNIFLSVYKKTVFLLILTVFSFQNATTQETKSDFWNHVRYGGGFGLNFANDFFSATIAPSAIYEFDKNFALGLGLNATFNNQKSVYKSTILGGSLVGLYNVVREIQLSTEFEQLNVNRRYNINTNFADENYWIPALYLGAGYRSGNVTFGIRYDVLYDDNRSIYADPWAPFVRLFF
ncbi:MAG: alpha-ketoglutarate decarboxylase [Algibacter sp.]|uniref:alpha-ketoglutarate decarboxylase n=1 Tax=Algibacter sp. TaxID=1872428 RepID=UPI00261B7011|nr:alpha-ketoglutarate decarboxylase [Algibacter sp.]MDG1731141.1 alpha-ketoglutarate decarboxylase [Algibacter sp.]MDG2179759.1 alpha-ketoglutarate decarboxylase [Algibacter sp.]